MVRGQDGDGGWVTVALVAQAQCSPKPRCKRVRALLKDWLKLFACMGKVLIQNSLSAAWANLKNG